MNIEIRFFDHSKDAKALGEIYNQALNGRFDFLPFNPARIRDLITFQSSLDIPNCGIIIAEDGGNRVGSIILYYNSRKNKDRACITGCAVKPKYQKKGIGKLLFQKAIKIISTYPVKYLDTYEEINVNFSGNTSNSNLLSNYSGSTSVPHLKHFKTHNIDDKSTSDMGFPNGPIFRHVLSKYDFKRLRSYSLMSCDLLKANIEEISAERISDNNEISISKIDRTIQDFKIYFKLENEIYRDTFRENVKSIYNLIEPESYFSEVYNDVENEVTDVYFIRLKNKPIGFISITSNNLINDFHDVMKGQISSFGVLKKYRNRGLGSQLLSHSLLLLREKGIEFAELSVDDENTSGAYRLYEKFGFKPFLKTILYRKKI